MERNFVNDTLDTDTIVEVLNGMRLKWDSYPPQFIDMLRGTKECLERELEYRENNPWIPPRDRHIDIEGSSIDLCIKGMPLSKAEKTTSTTFYENGRYNVHGVRTDRGPIKAVRYYENANDAHVAGMKWMEMNGLQPVEEA